MVMPKRRPTMRLALIALMLAAPAAGADEIASPARGETLTREGCAACHAVARGEVSPDTDATAFADIADLVSTTRQSLFVFLNTTHPTMPNLILEREESVNLMAYILSLMEN